MKRIFRNIKRGSGGCVLVLIPSMLVFLFFGAMMITVFTSKDGSFAECSNIIRKCVDDEEKVPLSFGKMGRLISCTMDVAWCDVETVYLKTTGQFEPLTKDIPPEFYVLEEEFEKNQAEVREYLMREDVIENSFEEHELYLKQKAETEIPPTAEELKQEMKRLRLEREQFEKDQNKFREEYYKKVIEKEENPSK